MARTCWDCDQSRSTFFLECVACGTRRRSLRFTLLATSRTPSFPSLCATNERTHCAEYGNALACASCTFTVKLNPQEFCGITGARFKGAIPSECELSAFPERPNRLPW